ncbi:transposase [Paraburkholderia sp. MM5482-R1]|uniref:transposase n=1 Tax=unclassified Paraburkholderia TaxID=2615204 RepID=UPI003D1ECC92
MFNALRWIVRAGAPWRLLPNDFPPWELVYQQTQRWIQAGCFEAMVNDLRSIIRIAQQRRGQPSAVILDGRTLQSTCESGPRAGYDGYKRKRGSKVHMAVDTLGQLLAVHVTPANEQERAQVGELARQVQQATGQTVKVAFADQAIYRRRACAGGTRRRDRASGSQAAGGEKGLRAVAAPLGGRAQLRLAQPLSPTGQRLRAIARNLGWLALRRILRAYACSLCSP